MSSSNTVVLFSGEVSPGTTSHTDASIDEAGDLIVATQDLGDAPQRAFGDRDYEWWIVVRAANKQALVARLLAQQESRATTAEAGRSEDALLLSLLEGKFAGRPSAPSDLRYWLDEDGISYEFSSYS